MTKPALPPLQLQARQKPPHLSLSLPAEAVHWVEKNGPSDVSDDEGTDPPLSRPVNPLEKNQVETPTYPSTTASSSLPTAFCTAAPAQPQRLRPPAVLCTAAIEQHAHQLLHPDLRSAIMVVHPLSPWSTATSSANNTPDDGRSQESHPSSVTFPAIASESPLVYPMCTLRLEPQITPCQILAVGVRNPHHCARLERAAFIYYAPYHSNHLAHVRQTYMISSHFLPVTLDITQSGPQLFCRQCKSIGFLHPLKPESLMHTMHITFRQLSQRSKTQLAVYDELFPFEKSMYIPHLIWIDKQEV